MKTKRAPLYIALALLIITVSSLHADKTRVVISSPPAAKKGADVTVTLEITHDGNNFLHHTEWVYFKVNGIEKNRWEFSAFNRPESGNFTRQVTLKVSEDLALEASGSCNIHGSHGIDRKTLRAE